MNSTGDSMSPELLELVRCAAGGENEVLGQMATAGAVVPSSPVDDVISLSATLCPSPETGELDPQANGTNMPAVLVIPNWKSISKSIMIDASGQNLLLYFTNTRSSDTISVISKPLADVGPADDSAAIVFAEAELPLNDLESSVPLVDALACDAMDLDTAELGDPPPENPDGQLEHLEADAAGTVAATATIAIHAIEHSYSSLPASGAEDKSTSSSRTGLKAMKVFVCEMCGQQFRDRTGLRRHRQAAHVFDTEYRCYMCGKLFQKKVHLQAHVRNTHIGGRPHKCTYCPKAFKTKHQLQAHLMIHNKEKPLTCKHCGRRFRWRTQLVGHLSKHGNLEEGPYKCSQCPMTFFAKWKLDHHSIKHQTDKPHECPICRKTFKRKEGLKTHKVVHTTERPFLCQLCGRSFKSHQTFCHHGLVHRADLPHRCTRCGKGFRTKSNLKQHEHSHTGEKPYVCEYCGRSYGSKGSFKDHILMHEVQKLPHACTECWKRFATEEDLQSHRLSVHVEGVANQDIMSNDGQEQQNEAGAKFSYTCTECKKVFSIQSKLERHYNTAHNVQLHHWCKDCGSAFRHARDLTYHRLVHLHDRPFGCIECGKRFKTSSVLREHVKIHGSETPHQCHLCTKAFKKKIQLTQHLISHSDVKLYACDLCGQTFKYKSGIKTHCKLKHAQEMPRAAAVVLQPSPESQPTGT